MRKRSIIQSFTQKCLTIIIWVPLACSCGNSKKCCNNVIVPRMVISLSTKQNLHINILLLTLNNAVLKIKSVSFFFSFTFVGSQWKWQDSALSVFMFNLFICVLVLLYFAIDNFSPQNLELSYFDNQSSMTSSSITVSLISLICAEF